MPASVQSWPKKPKQKRSKSEVKNQEPAPPGELLQLVADFLTSQGFHGTCDHYTRERRRRADKSEWWNDQLATSIVREGTPSLLRLYLDWRESQLSYLNPELDKVQVTVKDIVVSEDGTGSGNTSDSSSGSESSESSPEKTLPQAIYEKELLRTAKTNGYADSDDDSSSSSGDSDDSDEMLSATNALGAKASSFLANGTATKPERKDSPAAATSESDSSSGTESDESSEGPVVDKTEKKSNGIVAAQQKEPLASKAKSKPAAAASTDSSSSSSEESSEDEDASPVVDFKKQPVVVEKDGAQKRKRSTSPRDTSVADAAKKTKKNNVPFQRVPANTYIDPRLTSNAYRSHDYGDQAYRDLSVTKGKGFTKEKNKKKRGSYRGGTIDISGGRSIKFDD